MRYLFVISLVIVLAGYYWLDKLNGLQRLSRSVMADRMESVYIRQSTVFEDQLERQRQISGKLEEIRVQYEEAIAAITQSTLSEIDELLKSRRSRLSSPVGVKPANTAFDYYRSLKSELQKERDHLSRQHTSREREIVAQIREMNMTQPYRSRQVFERVHAKPSRQKRVREIRQREHASLTSHADSSWKEGQRRLYHSLDSARDNYERKLADLDSRIEEADRYLFIHKPRTRRGATSQSDPARDILDRMNGELKSARAQYLHESSEWRGKMELAMAAMEASCKEAQQEFNELSAVLEQESSGYHRQKTYAVAGFGTLAIIFGALFIFAGIKPTGND